MALLKCAVRLHRIRASVEDLAPLCCGRFWSACEVFALVDEKVWRDSVISGSRYTGCVLSVKLICSIVAISSHAALPAPEPGPAAGAGRGRGACFPPPPASHLPPHICQQALSTSR